MRLIMRLISKALPIVALFLIPSIMPILAARQPDTAVSVYPGSIPLIISMYDPALGGTNCMEPCGMTATGDQVAEWYGRGAACPIRFTKVRAEIFVPDVGWFTCIDTGGGIVETAGGMWIDLLLREQDFYTIPYHYGDRVPAGEWRYRIPTRTGELYHVPVTVTDPNLHGLDGWQGVDIKGECGAELFNPLGDAIVTYSGPDGYVGPYSGGVQNSMLTLRSGDEELTLLHGRYKYHVGDSVPAGALIGWEDRIGNATGCHSHVIFRIGGRTVNYLEAKGK